jgi:hypothetical protein
VGSGTFGSTSPQSTSVWAFHESIIRGVDGVVNVLNIVLCLLDSENSVIFGNIWIVLSELFLHCFFFTNSIPFCLFIQISQLSQSKLCSVVNEVSVLSVLTL